MSGRSFSLALSDGGGFANRMCGVPTPVSSPLLVCLFVAGLFCELGVVVAVDRKRRLRAFRVFLVNRDGVS